MDKNLMDALYVSYDEKIGVLCDDKDNTISHILGTDLTLVLDKKDMAVYLLVPLTETTNLSIRVITSLWMASSSILTSFSARMLVNGFRCNQKKCYQW